MLTTLPRQRAEGRGVDFRGGRLLRPTCKLACVAAAKHFSSIFTVFALFFTPLGWAQQDCFFSEGCRQDECAVSDIRGGAKCVAKQYAVMVWDTACIKSVQKTLKTKIEAPLKDDGSPDMAQSLMLNATVDLDQKCGRIEIRKRRGW